MATSGVVQGAATLVVRGTCAGDDLARALAVAGLTRAELHEVARVLERSAEFVRLCASMVPEQEPQSPPE